MKVEEAACLLRNVLVLYYPKLVSSWWLMALAR